MKKGENKEFFPKKCIWHAGKFETAAKKIGRHFGRFSVVIWKERTVIGVEVSTGVAG